MIATAYQSFHVRVYLQGTTKTRHERLLELLELPGYKKTAPVRLPWPCPEKKKAFCGDIPLDVDSQVPRVFNAFLVCFFVFISHDAYISTLCCVFPIKEVESQRSSCFVLPQSLFFCDAKVS